jgi:aromatic-L-amino-acid decarboxylase
MTVRTDPLLTPSLYRWLISYHVTVINYYDTITENHVLPSVTPGYLRPQLPSTAPEDPEPWSAIHADLQSKIFPGLTHWQSPHFMAFFPSLGSFPGLLGELYSGAFNGAHFNWICSPAVTELETVVLDWTAKALGLPACFLSEGETGGGGVIHGSASEAILTVMTAARDRYLDRKMEGVEGSDDEKEEVEWRVRRKLVALGSQMAHSSTKKAAQILGVRFRTIPILKEDLYAVTGENFRKAVEDCCAEGLEPFYMTATYGTTDVCAVDDMVGISSAVESFTSTSPYPAPWIHVDAAYAGAAFLLPQYQPTAASMATFDSFNFNPHKWLLTNFDCSALYLRSRAPLLRSMSIQPPYLRNALSDAGLVTDYRDWQIPLGRRFRSLKLWFVLRSFGLKGLRDHIAGGITRAEVLAGLLASRPDLFEVVAGGPRFGLVVLRIVGEGDQESSERGKRVYDMVNAERDVFLTGTMLDGVFCIRVSTGGFRMEETHVKRVFGILVRLAEEVHGGKSRKTDSR